LSHQALICLRLQDAEGYRNSWRALLKDRGPVPMMRGLNSVALAAWTCAVSPDAGGDALQAIQQSVLVREAVAQPYVFHRAAGAALYRAGDFKAAVQRFQDAMDEAGRTGPEATPTVWLFLAMAEHRLNHPDKAREWLDKARAWTAAARKSGPDGGGREAMIWDNLPWPERLALELLQAEAEKLIPGGSDKLVGAAESLELVGVCRAKGLHAAAARFFMEAFAAEPKLADDFRAARRYDAACSAALAASGQGRDAPAEESTRSKLRRQALAWLRADLEAWAKLADDGNAAERKAAPAAMRHWQGDAGLVAVRHPLFLLLFLPAEERRDWLKLWTDVEALRGRAEAGR
jgi:serine/threonine-protein kinase